MTHREKKTIKQQVATGFSSDKQLVEDVIKLKEQKNAIILSHFYQDKHIQDIADFVGDSLELSRKAAETKADIIVFAGVRFMAETAKILNPSKKVLIPDMNAGCSLADTCKMEQIEKLKKKYPDYKVVSYINCYVEIKANSDFVCTSSNAEAVINQIPKKYGIIFIPDMNLGNYLINKTGREMILWPGTCTVHESFSLKKIQKLKDKYPNAKVIAHPECSYLVLELADFIGSTSMLIKYAQSNPSKEFIVVTEEGILHQMKKTCPEKIFIPAPPIFYTDCACGECPYMKLNTLPKLYQCLEEETPEILIDEILRLQALEVLQKMLVMN